MTNLFSEHQFELAGARLLLIRALKFRPSVTFEMQLQDAILKMTFNIGKNSDN